MSNQPNGQIVVNATANNVITGITINDPGHTHGYFTTVAAPIKQQFTFYDSNKNTVTIEEHELAQFVKIKELSLEYPEIAEAYQSLQVLIRMRS